MSIIRLGYINEKDKAISKKDVLKKNVLVTLVVFTVFSVLCLYNDLTESQSKLMYLIAHSKEANDCEFSEPVQRDYVFLGKDRCVGTE